MSSVRLCAFELSPRILCCCSVGGRKEGRREMEEMEGAGTGRGREEDKDWIVVRSRKGKARSGFVLQGNQNLQSSCCPGSSHHAFGALRGRKHREANGEHGVRSSWIDQQRWLKYGNDSSSAPLGDTGEREEEEVEKLVLKVRRTMEKVQQSGFFKTFVKQLRDLGLLETLSKKATGSVNCELLGGPPLNRLEEGEEAFTTPEGEDVLWARECQNSHLGWRRETELMNGSSESASEPLESKVEPVTESNVRDDEVRPETCGGAKTEADPTDGNLRQERDIELVVYGVGSIADSDVSRCQLSLAILLKHTFQPFIREVIVYDPVLSSSECSAVRVLGCSPLSLDEQGRRRAQAPTLFYMPHCEVGLYDNVLQANLNPWCLGQLAILGNSFQRYQERWSVFPNPKVFRPDCLLELQMHVVEHTVDAESFPLPSAFNDMSLHLFPYCSPL